MLHRLFLLLTLSLFSLPLWALNLYGIPADQVAVWVADIDSDQPVLAEYRADAAVNPASTMKLVTSYSGLMRLGPTFQWQTRLASNAPIVDGVLQGDLYWIGSGDPMFDQDNLLMLLKELRLRGIHAINGRLILDGSIWTSIGHAEDFGDDSERAFMVAPDPHLTALKVAWVVFFFDNNGPRAVLDPPRQGVRLQTELTEDPSPLNCPDVRQRIKIQEAGDTIRISGRLPRACDRARSYINVLGHAAFAEQSFIAQWRALGGTGPSGLGHAKAPANAQVLAQYDSQPLSEALYGINKFSNNTMARTLYLTMGVQEAKGLDTVAGAEAAVRRTLAQSGISDEVLVLENGAGLSRRERVSARMMGELLRQAARGPYASEFIASLPIAGVDGTLKHRFAKQAGRLRLKTGTLANVRALAGYWQAPNGHRLALVVIVNSDNARQYIPAMEKIIAEQIAAYQTGSGR